VCCLASAEAWAHMPAAQCSVADAQGMQVIATQPLRPSKRWTHYRIAEDLFLEFRYDDVNSTVAVMTVRSPHYPWTISERTLERTVVRMGGVPSKGESTIRTNNLAIMCEELDRA